MVERKFNDVEIVCAACGARLLVRRGRPGLVYKCPKCTEILNFDTPSTRPAAESVEAMPMVRLKDPGPLGPGDEYGVATGVDQPPEKTYFPVVCPTCRTKMYAAPEQVGKSLTCPDCRKSVIVPSPPMPEPKPPPIITELLDDHYKVLPGVDQPPAASASTEKQFAVTCPLCHTRLSATAKQVGQSITCPDCGRPFKVKAPEPPKTQRRWVEDDGIEIPIAPTFERPMTVVPLHESLTRPKVKRTVSEAPSLPAWPLVSGVFNFLFYRNVWPYWLGYGSWLALAFTGLYFAIYFGQHSISMMLTVFMLKPVVLAFGCLWFATSSLFRSITQDTADGLDRVENWPDSIFLAAEISDPFYPLNAVGLTIVVGGALMALLRGAGAEAWFVGPVCTVVFFPLFLLSMLANDSPMMPFSRPVWSGVARSIGSWAMFYLESTLILGSVAYLAFLAWNEGNALWLLGAGLLIFGACLLYARLLGRLAWITALQDEEEDSEDDSEAVDDDYSKRSLVSRV